MDMIYSAARVLQLLIMSSLLQVFFPANITLCFEVLMQFANADILDAQGFYEDHFKIKHQEALTQKFEEFNLESMAFLLNSGSIFVILVLIFIRLITQYLVNELLIKLANYKYARKLGYMFYLPD